LAALLLSSAAALAADAVPESDPAKVPEIRAGSGILMGYLARKDLPNSLALLPPPPAAGSMALAADEEAHQKAKAQRSPARFALAASDAGLRFPAAAATFSCALGAPISAQATPHLTMLLRRSLTDAGLATYAAKDSYQRQRPFAAMKDGTCAPASEAALAKDGSYPSGHAALGWGWALLLAELAPDRADALLQRGHAFGQSRVICGVHWQSDVDQGRLVGAATVARLHADPTFSAQAALARQEIVQARAKGLKSPLNCAAEAQALGR
jgi:acid phosphatase (class A)